MSFGVTYRRVRSWLEDNVRVVLEPTARRPVRRLRIAELEVTTYMAPGSSEWGVLVGFDERFPTILIRVHKFRIEFGWRDIVLDESVS